MIKTLKGLKQIVDNLELNIDARNVEDDNATDEDRELLFWELKGLSQQYQKRRIETGSDHYFTRRLGSVASLMALLGLLLLAALSDYFGGFEIRAFNDFLLSTPLGSGWYMAITAVLLLLLLFVNRPKELGNSQGYAVTVNGNIELVIAKQLAVFEHVDVEAAVKAVKTKVSKNMTKLSELEQAHKTKQSASGWIIVLLGLLQLFGLFIFDLRDIAAMMLFWGIVIFVMAYSTNRKYGYTRGWSRNRHYINKAKLLEDELKHRLDSVAAIRLKMHELADEQSAELHKDVVGDYIEYGNSALKFFSSKKLK